MKNVEIKVSGNTDSLTQADSQRIKRCSNMLIEAGFNVNIIWNAVMGPVKINPKHPLRSELTHY